MHGYALDSDIISKFLRRDFELQEKVHQKIYSNEGVFIPALAYFEVKRGLIYLGSNTSHIAFDRLRSMTNLVPVDEAVLDRASVIHVQLQKTGQPIGDADVLIAASCLVHGHVLITNNVRHFQRIEDRKSVV